MEAGFGATLGLLGTVRHAFGVSLEHPPPLLFCEVFGFLTWFSDGLRTIPAACEQQLDPEGPQRSQRSHLEVAKICVSCWEVFPDIHLPGRKFSGFWLSVLQPAQLKGVLQVINLDRGGTSTPDLLSCALRAQSCDSELLQSWRTVYQH